LIHLYIGSGKGKTTAAVGLAIRAAGRGMRVLFCQFLKAVDSGELAILESIREVRVFRPSMRHKGFLWNQDEKELAETGEDIRKGWSDFKSIIRDEVFDVIILDEVLDLISSRYLGVDDILETVSEDSPEFVLTGRDAPSALIETADYVTRMEAVKHPYRRGIPARKGIEY
jgi:cob(I)alamin adenosyltransferase